jgi:hypothetical protein
MSQKSFKMKGPPKPNTVRPYTREHARPSPKEKPKDIPVEVWKRDCIRREIRDDRAPR